MDDATNLPLSYAFVVCFVVTRKKTTKNTTKASSLSLCSVMGEKVSMWKKTQRLFCFVNESARGEGKKKENKKTITKNSVSEKRVRSIFLVFFLFFPARIENAPPCPRHLVLLPIFGKKNKDLLVSFSFSCLRG